MLRFLNIFAVLALMGSAVYAYTIKYQTAFRAEQIAKTRLEIRAERNAIAVLRAEWAFLTRPERIQQLSDRYLPELRAAAVAQIVPAQAVPDRAARVDTIARTLDILGLGAPSTPAADAKSAPTTKAAQTTAKTAPTTPKPAPTTPKGAGHKP